MTIRTKTIKQTVTVNEAIVCDMCGAVSKSGYDWPIERGSWSRTYETTVEIELREGCSDGGETTTVRVDLCPRCFKGELLEWLRSRGVVCVTENTDW